MNRIQVSFLGLLLCFVALEVSSAGAVKSGICPPERFYNSSYIKQSYCQHDGECPGDKKCCSDNGFRFCKPPAKERGGSCPRPPPKTFTSPRPDDFCSIDSECAPGSKCCPTDSGFYCLPSIGEKKGFCGEGFLCFVPERPQCNNDTGCPGKEKCCLDGCTVRCIAPLKVRPGRCPSLSHSSIPKNRCKSDYDCTHPDKCCNTHLGKRCRYPFYD